MFETVVFEWKISIWFYYSRGDLIEIGKELIILLGKNDLITTELFVLISIRIMIVNQQQLLEYNTPRPLIVLAGPFYIRLLHTMRRVMGWEYSPMSVI
jgi:hypothetical protein